MSKINVKKIITKLEENLKVDPPKYKGFVTVPGKMFQNDFKDLMRTIQISNIIPGILNILNPAIDFLEKEYNEKKDELSFQATGEVIIIQKNKDPIINPIDLNDTNFFDLLRETGNIPKKVIKEISQVVARLNSYYFLALYAYFDLYSLSMYKLIISKLDETKIFDLINSFRSMSNPKRKINQIRESLKLNQNYNLTNEIKINAWEKSLKNFIWLRHSIAHRKPLINIPKINEEFPEIAEYANSKTQKMLQVSFTDHSNVVFSTKVKKIFEPIFQTLNILVKFGEECFNYLAIIDILINDHISKNL